MSVAVAEFPLIVEFCEPVTLMPFSRALLRVLLLMVKSDGPTGQSPVLSKL